MRNRARAYGLRRTRKSPPMPRSTPPDADRGCCYSPECARAARRDGRPRCRLRQGARRLMRIAVVADIHGNVRALRAVMDDLKEVAADRVINLGDTVSGPLEAAETADVLISLAWTTVRGNHDRQLLDRPAEQMGASDQAAFAQLKSHHKSWLNSLQETVEFEGLIFCHGTPDNDVVYLAETVEPYCHVRSATRAEVSRLVSGVRSTIVFCGHSHIERALALDH